jgi:DNA-binding transcriptional ArsR family regulator
MPEMATRRVMVWEGPGAAMEDSMPLAGHQRFVYGETMDAGSAADAAVARIAAAIGEPARTRMLYSLMDGHARTSTELAAVAEVSASTASVHLSRLKAEKLVTVMEQGRHRYFSLGGPDVARALERLSVLAGGAGKPFVPRTPDRLRSARRCYDHMAGTAAVRLHDRFVEMRWIRGGSAEAGNEYELTAEGAHGFGTLGVDIEAARALRRRFAYGCLDWSERRPHVGGALGAALLKLALARRWVTGDLDSRALSFTASGRSEMRKRFGLEL